MGEIKSMFFAPDLMRTFVGPYLLTKVMLLMIGRTGNYINLLAQVYAGSRPLALFALMLLKHLMVIKIGVFMSR